jgi:hypothetical protein
MQLSLSMGEIPAFKWALKLQAAFKSTKYGAFQATFEEPDSLPDPLSNSIAFVVANQKPESPSINNPKWFAVEVSIESAEWFTEPATVRPPKSSTHASPESHSSSSPNNDSSYSTTFSSPVQLSD